MEKKPKYWVGPVGPLDDFGVQIHDEFIDGQTYAGRGSWAIMSRGSWRLHGNGMGPGKGQRYRRQPDGRWLKVEG